MSYLVQADWALSTATLAPVWLHWLTNGLYAGARRIELNIQVDDVFMSTGTYSLETNDEDLSEAYRLLPGDLDVSPKPPHSFFLTFRFSLSYHGNKMSMHD